MPYREPTSTQEHPMRSFRRALRALRHHISTAAAYELAPSTREYPVSPSFGPSRSRSRSR